MTQPQAIVVLGCAVTRDGQPSAALLRRLSAGLEAWRLGKAPSLWLSGGRRWGNHAEATVMAGWLQARGVPPEVLELELLSQTTAQNAWYCSKRAQTGAVRNIVLVTCEFHMPRALRCFEAAGFECEAFAAPGPGPGWLLGLTERARNWVARQGWVHRLPTRDG